MGNDGDRFRQPNDNISNAQEHISNNSCGLDDRGERPSLCCALQESPTSNSAQSFDKSLSDSQYLYGFVLGR